MQEYGTSGLRERKKAATRLAIEQAAVEIAWEQGYEAATAEAIAGKADVSLRTFFNYFPSKDVAIVGKGLALIDEERAHRVLEESDVDLLKGIVRVAAECGAERGPTTDLMRQRRRRLIHKNPPLFYPQMRGIARFEGWLARIVADHLRTHPSRRRLSGRVTVEEEARLAVAVVSSAVHYLVQQSIERDIDANLGTTDIEQTIDMMAEIHRKDS
jgi:AcrR family transcriptional regulator